MTWDAFHRRGEVLRAVVEAADERRDGVLPMDLPGVTETFGDELALIGALQLRWHTRLSGTIEHHLMEQPEDLPSAVLAAWRTAADELAGIRAILDAYTESPSSEDMARALLTAHRKDWVLLAVMAGLASASDDRALAVGHDLERRARAAYRPTLVPGDESRGRRRRTSSPSFTESLLGRLKAHRAA
jgi:hypothetical protein